MGQIEDASFTFAGTRLTGMPVGVSTALGAVGGFIVESWFELSVGFMSGVVAQIQPRENMNVPGHECEPGCALGAF